jgi:hypothetical protein
LAVVGLSFNFAGVLPSVWKGFPREATLDQTTSWQVSLDALRAKPLLGSGLGTFFYDFSRFRKPDFNQNSLWQVRFDRPVSHLAELLATTGFLGIFSYLLLVGFSLFGLLSLAFRKRETGYETLFFALLASCLAQVFYYQNAATGFVFWLLLGVTAGSVGREKTFSWPFCFKIRLARLVLVIKILWLSLIIATPLKRPNLKRK